MTLGTGVIKAAFHWTGTTALVKAKGARGAATANARSPSDELYVRGTAAVGAV